MCGTAGLTIGCSMAARCPKSLLIEKTAAASATRADSHGPLASWETRASVRTRAQPLFDENSAAPLFPAELVPIASHSLVIGAGEDVHHKVIARQLYRYMHFTAKLEHLVVNRSAQALANGETGFEMPERIRLEAFKLYCDEAYHAVVAADFAAAVARKLGMVKDWQREPYFIGRLERIKEDAGAELAPLLEFLFVICSETLISGTLSQVAQSDDVNDSVRQALDDHAHDERRHHSYFREVLIHLWPQLTQRAKRESACRVPELINAFLHPDLDGCREELSGYGLGRDAIEQVLAESYPDDVVRADRRHIARYTVQYFQEVEALESQSVLNAFAAAGLLT